MAILSELELHEQRQNNITKMNKIWNLCVINTIPIFSIRKYFGNFGNISEVEDFAANILFSQNI